MIALSYSSTVAAVCTALLIACGNSESRAQRDEHDLQDHDSAHPNHDGGSEDEKPNAAEPDVEPGFLTDRGDGWKVLIDASWNIPGGSETYRCARVTVPRDTYVTEVRALSPLGTHHTILSVDEAPTAPDGVTECDVLTNAPRSIYGSGVGTEDYAFPDGVAVKIAAGHQLLLNLHLFNVKDEALSGLSGVYVRVVEPDDIEHLAEAVLSGPIDLQIPPGRVVESGSCTVASDVTVFAVLPHMHQLGVHMKGVVSTQDGEKLLHDKPYVFDQQLLYAIDPLQLRANDRIDVECTYENDGDSTVTFGSSSMAEMCFLYVWGYASDGGPFTCIPKLD